MKTWNAYGAAVSEGSWGALEDGFFLDPKTSTFAVVDGFGGGAIGESTVHLVVQELRKKNLELETRWSGGISCLEKQIKLFEELNGFLLEKNHAKGGGCSLVFGEIWGGSMLSVSGVGECSVHLIRDHLFYSLLMPQADLLNLQRRPRIPDQVLGLFPRVVPETRDVQIHKGDVLVLCSGGVPFEEEEWKSELISLLGLRLEGESLGQIAERCVSLTLGQGVPRVNQGLVLVEL